MQHPPPPHRGRSAASQRQHYVAPPEIVERVRAHVDAVGLVRACQVLDTSRETATRILAGLGVHRGSIAKVERALAARDAAAIARAEDGTT